MPVQWIYHGNIWDDIWVNYNDLTGIMVSKRNHPQMALIQAGELLYFTQMIWDIQYLMVGEVVEEDKMWA
jgi:hypothetical protein